MRPISELPIRRYTNNPKEQRNSVGEKAAIRFFDSNDQSDMSRLKEIIAGSATQKWMEGVDDLDDKDLRTWAKEKGGWRKGQSFLFAIVNNSDNQNKSGEVMGFTYLYSGNSIRSNKARAIEKGFLPSDARNSRVYEASFAVIPDTVGKQESSGLISSGLRQAMFEVDRVSYKNHLRDTLYKAFIGLDEAGFERAVQDISISNEKRLKPDTYFFAFVDPRNSNSARTLEAAGYVQVGEMTYDEDEEDNPEAIKDRVYVLNWEEAQKKLQDKSYKEVFKQ